MKENFYHFFLFSLTRLPDFFFEILFQIFYPYYALTRRHRAWGRVQKHLKNCNFHKVSPKAVFHSLFFNALDSYRVLTHYKPAIRKIHIENEKLIQDTLQKGIPVVAMSIHLGAFEMMHRLLCRYSNHVHLFTRSFSQKGLTQALAEARFDPHLQEHSTDKVGRVLHAFYREKGILAMVVDQAHHDRGNAVTLFGHPATLFLRLPVYACKQGAAIITFRTYRTPNGNHTIRFEHVYPPKTPEKILVPAIAKEVEYWISKHPEQWTWNYHRNFTQDLK